MAQKKKVLIIGGTGYIGSNLAKSLSAKHSVICTHRKDFTPMDGVEYLRFVELTDKDQCKNLIQKIEPEVVIYTVGSNDAIAAEKEAAQTQILHSTGASMVMTASDYIKAKYIYISSDWVFSGTEGNYSESDTAMPYSQLGKAKLGAENYIRSRSTNHAIIRASLLLGRGTLQHPSWLDVLREHQLSKKKMNLSDMTFVNPVHVSKLIQLVEKIIDQDIRNKTLHLGGLTKVSLFDLGQAFLKEFDYDLKLLEASEPAENATESDFSLNFTQTIRSLKIEPLLLEQSLDLLK